MCRGGIFFILLLAGKPTYPDVPDLKQEKTRPKPKKNF